MTIREVMNEAIKGQYTSLILMIELLVIEKKVINFDDDESKLDFYFQDKFKDKMNGHIKELKNKKGVK